MNITIFTPSRLVEKLKQQARKLKKEQGLSHREALDQVAKNLHYHHWHHVTEMAAITAPTEDAYRNGFLVAYDSSEADLDSDFLVEDDLSWYFCEEGLWETYLEIEDEEDPEFHYLPEQKQREYFMDFINDLVFFRYVGEKIPNSVDDALKLTNECSFWSPMYIWIKGQIYDTYGAPATDPDGNIVGVRF